MADISYNSLNHYESLRALGFKGGIAPEYESASESMSVLPSRHWTGNLSPSLDLTQEPVHVELNLTDLQKKAIVHAILTTRIVEGGSQDG